MPSVGIERTAPATASVPEEWRDVPGFEGLYAVSDMGNVYSCRRGRNMKTRSSVIDGYLRQWPVMMTGADGKRTSRDVSTLVALAFIGPCPVGSRTFRLNADPLDSRLCNLKYLASAKAV